MALNIFEELDLTSSGDNVDEGFLKCKNNWSDMDTELNNARDGEASLLAKIDTLAPTIGHYRRSPFTYVDGDTITVGGGSYDVDGTLANITSALTTTAHGVTGADWAYLYIDYSSLPTDNILIQSDLIWATTEPAWSHTKLGWYNGSDRCIFACRIAVTSDDILEFTQQGDYVHYNASISLETTDAAYTDAYADAPAFVMPVFSRKANATFWWVYSNAENNLLYLTKGGAAGGGQIVGVCKTGATESLITTDVVTNSSHLIQLKESSNSTNTVTFVQNGFYLPDGI